MFTDKSNDKSKTTFLPPAPTPVTVFLSDEKANDFEIFRHSGCLY